MPGGDKHVARKLKRAQILPATDAARTDQAIAANVSVGLSTVYRTKRGFVPGNPEAALSETPRSGAARKPSAEQQAVLVVTHAPTRPPAGGDGRSSCWPTRWSSRPLARRSRARLCVTAWRRLTSVTE
jgi:transposase